MKFYEYAGRYYTASELAELSGVNYTTICARLKAGYSAEEAIAETWKIPESVEAFLYASHAPDWNYMTTDKLYDVYMTWCLKHDYGAESKIHFMRSIKRCVPVLKIVPSKVTTANGVKSQRVIRVLI